MDFWLGWVKPARLVMTEAKVRLGLVRPAKPRDALRSVAGNPPALEKPERDSPKRLRLLPQLA